LDCSKSWSADRCLPAEECEAPRAGSLSMTTSFGITYDYRCPFARNAHEHVVAALRAGADWDVQFVPFSLSQIHVEEGDTPVWDDPDGSGDLLALEASIVVADKFPDRFLDVHEALFAARHDQARDLRDEKVLADVLDAAGVDATAVTEQLRDKAVLEQLRKSHEDSVSDHQVFGVPTFIVGDRAAFVRIMTRPHGDAEVATATIERVLVLLTDHPELNELKHTTVAN
jgi:DSBA-like thioredoxin domain